jgi:hypothetical protein
MFSITKAAKSPKASWDNKASKSKVSSGNIRRRHRGVLMSPQKNASA